MKEKLSGVFNHMHRCKVLVLGDLMLDTYTIGKAGRISPEAPVPVMRVEKTENKPGGAGNVALNLVSLGADVVLMGRVGKDAAGELLLQVLKEENIDLQGILVEEGYQTPVKNRVIADNQQMIRVDYEKICDTTPEIEEKALGILLSLIPHVDIVAVSDYGKGFLLSSLLRQVIDICKSCGVPVVVDPKGKDFTKYAGATILKPNWSEAVAAAALPPQASLDEIAKVILDDTKIETLIVTRSKEGISTISHAGERKDYPVKVREVKDVTGAGDTVLAVLACALANKLSLDAAVRLSNIAAGIAVERLGCVRVTLGEIAQRSLEADVENKIFDEEHLYALQESVKGQHCAILGIDSKEGLTEPLFEAIDYLRGLNNSRLMIYLRDSDPSKTFVKMLASLSEIDFIIIKRESLRSFSTLIRPDHVYVFEKTLKEYPLEQLYI